MRPHHLYITIVAVVFAAFAGTFLALPRSTYSALEKRDLKTFPKFSVKSLLSADYTREVSEWFSDSEPYRDQLLSAAMELRNANKVNFEGEEKITFHAAEPSAAPLGADADAAGGEPPAPADIPEEGVTKIGAAGIMILGQEPRVRALMAYGGTAKGGGEYARAVNRYAEALRADGVRVYAMVIPNATEFYLPASARSRSKSQAATINNVYSLLDASVKGIDVVSQLAAHRDQDIFLRTDHHWAPLGAYYAAKEFARVAGVPFKAVTDTSAYQRRVLHGYVGSMYGYSKDASVKRSPEDFVYWTPRTRYTTTYRTYTLDKKYNVTATSGPVKGEYFFKFKDGSGQAYCTFMGSDARLTKVDTSVPSNRRLLVIKDSYGNAIPGYLFYSFGQVHVADFRYFQGSLAQYIRDNAITDVLFAHTVFNAFAPSVARKLTALL